MQIHAFSKFHTYNRHCISWGSQHCQNPDDLRVHCTLWLLLKPPTTLASLIWSKQRLQYAVYEQKTSHSRIVFVSFVSLVESQAGSPGVLAFRRRNGGGRGPILTALVVEGPSAMSSPADRISIFSVCSASWYISGIVGADGVLGLNLSISSYKTPFFISGVSKLFFF